MKKFDEIYNEILQESFSNNIENEQSEYRKFYFRHTKVILTLLISGILSIIVIFAILFLVPNLSDKTYGILGLSLFLIFGMIFIGAFVLATKESSSKSPQALFTRKYKEKVITPLIKNFDQNLNYDFSKGISKEIYNQASFEPYSHFYSDDYISRKFKWENTCYYRRCRSRT